MNKNPTNGFPGGINVAKKEKEGMETPVEETVETVEEVVEETAETPEVTP